MHRGISTQRVNPDRGSVPTVPPCLSRPHRSVCWGCDQDATELVTVMLHTPWSGTATFRLCRPCSDSIAPRVVARAAEAGIAIIRTGARSGPA